jgi:hypothetical protein
MSGTKRRNSRGLQYLASTVGAAGLAVCTLLALPGVAGAATPGFPAYKNTLNSKTTGWCTAAEGCNGQIGAGDFGTIDIVPTTFSNDGGYAAAAPSPGKQKHYGRVSGAGTDQDSLAGCSAPGSENCTGPFILFGGTGTASAFPTKTGFRSSIEIYLDTAWAAANPGQVVDWDVSLNDNTGAFLRDFVFNLCTTAANGGGFYVSESNNAGGCSTGPAEATTSGWYTLEQQFYDIGGSIAADLIAVDPSGNTVASSLQQTGILAADAGGPDYGWFPDEDILGLPIAQVLLKGKA